MDDLLFAGGTLSDVETFAREGIELFESRGFKLRKWVTNGYAKSVLRQVPQCDHAPSVGKIDIGSQPCRTLQRWAFPGTQKVTTLKISGRTFVEAATRREMASQLASRVSNFPDLLWYQENGKNLTQNRDPGKFPGSLRIIISIFLYVVNDFCNSKYNQ